MTKSLLTLFVLSLVGCTTESTLIVDDTRLPILPDREASAGEYQPEFEYGAIPQENSDSEHVLYESGFSRPTTEEETLVQLANNVETVNATDDALPVKKKPIRVPKAARDIWQEYCNDKRPLEEFSDEDQAKLSQAPDNLDQYDCYLGKDNTVFPN